MNRFSLPLRTSFGVLLGISLASSVRAQLPPVPVPPENPITDAKRVLGKTLFWEEQLSSDNTVACGTCHIPAFAGSDPRLGSNPGFDSLFGTVDDVVGSPGVSRADANDDFIPDRLFGFEAQVTGRAAPSVIGSQWAPEMFWDGRAGGTFLNPDTGLVSIASGGALENQVVGPPLSDVEMAHESRDWSSIAAKLAQVQPMALASNLPPDVATAVAGGASYGDLFSSAFGDNTITAERIAYAIATYERTLVADQTPFDLGTMTPLQQQGFTFLQDHTVCFNCHAPPLFTDNEFYNIGLRPSGEDLGRELVTGNPSDRGAFKTPTLRNIGLKTEMMHVGWITGVQDAIDFYNANTQSTGHTQFTQDQSSIPPGGGTYANINMPAQFQPNVIDFLENGLTDPRVANELPPFDRPTLHSENSTPNPNLVGSGTAGRGGIVPRMLAASPPLVASPGFKVGVASGLGGAVAHLVFVSPSPGPHPGSGMVNIAPVWRSPAATIVLDGAGAGGGYGTVHLDLESVPASLIPVVTVQWLILDPSAPGGVARSEAAELTLLP